MKKLLKLLVSLSLVCTINTCTHIHDEECGYDEATNSGCTHQCELIEPQQGWTPEG